MGEYKNLKEAQSDIRSGVLFDIINVDGVIFTMDFYDKSGKEITYGNKRKNKGILVETEDRYKLGFQDAVLSWIEDHPIRNDIHYYE